MRCVSIQPLTYVSGHGSCLMIARDLSQSQIQKAGLSSHPTDPGGPGVYVHKKVEEFLEIHSSSSCQ